MNSIPFGLRSRVLILIAVAFVMAAIPLYFLLHSELSGVLRARLSSSYTIVGKQIAEHGADLIMTDALVQLHMLLRDVKKSNEEIAYIYVVDRHNKPIAHTFHDGVPAELLSSNILEQGVDIAKKHIHYGEDVVEDMALPVFGHKLGVVHIGILLKKVEDALWLSTVRIAGYIGVVFLFVGSIVVFLVAQFLAPIGRIVKAAHRIGEGNLDQKIALHTGDEIELIAASIDRMTDRLKDVTVSRDRLLAEIEERKKVQAQLTEAGNQLIQSEKMASLGQLAAGVAHEINNPIGFVSSNLDVLRMYFSKIRQLFDGYAEFEVKLQALGTPEAQALLSAMAAAKEECEFAYVLADIPKILEDCAGGMHRMRGIVMDLKTFAHKGSVEKEFQDVHAIIENALSVARGSIKHKATINKDFAADLPPVKCHAQQLSQVFLNLIVNAIQAIDTMGEITIRTFLKERQVVVEISDTGCGMDEAVLPRIFEPFFTTKPVGIGTGLGLSISYGIIKGHGGVITVGSKINEGTTFTIMLPVDEPDAQEA